MSVLLNLSTRTAPLPRQPLQPPEKKEKRKEILLKVLIVVVLFLPFVSVFIFLALSFSGFSFRLLLLENKMFKYRNYDAAFLLQSCLWKSNWPGVRIPSPSLGTGNLKRPEMEGGGRALKRNHANHASLSLCLPAIKHHIKVHIYVLRLIRNNSRT